MAAASAASTATFGEGAEQYDRAVGSICGLAVCDALGAAVEGAAFGSFRSVTEHTAAGSSFKGFPNPHRLSPGMFTDDTSMAWCLGASIVRNGGVNPVNQIELYRQWWQEGKWSSNGKCFDIGNRVKQSITRRGWRSSPLLKPLSPADGAVGSNGGLMRTAPVGVAFSRAPSATLARAARDCSLTTHSFVAGLDACVVVSLLVADAVTLSSPIEGREAAAFDKSLAERGGSAALSDARDTDTRASAIVARLLDPARLGCRLKEAGVVLCPAIADIVLGQSYLRGPGPLDCVFDCRSASAPLVRARSSVTHTLEAALWGLRAHDFVKGAVAVCNLGGDADTAAAVYGGIAGAVFGWSAVPEGWKVRLACRCELEAMARALLDCRIGVSV